MSTRFATVIKTLNALKVDQNPELQREVDLAVEMILGKRPNVEQKYDELLLKLDRTYTQLEDVRDHMKLVAETHVMHSIRKNAKIRGKCINKMLTSMAWMRAKNNDLIRALKKEPEPVEPVNE